MGKDLKANKLSKFEDLTVDTLRVLSCEMINEAKSGHSGVALGAAPIFYTLFKYHIVADNSQDFINRDRFILSAGHASALLYATMHLAGYNSISLNDLKSFRKINAKTTGHPENHTIRGIDASTGPLGQGLGIALGCAIAETKLNTYFKKYKLFDYYTYCFFGDGCFQEGISYEIFSLAAKFKLNKLIFIYDSNDIQLEGRVEDNTVINNKKYFEALGLNYIKVDNGNSVFHINEAINEAKKSIEKPTVIEIKTKIGFGSHVQDSFKAHGLVLDKQGLEILKNNLNYHNDKFEISRNAYEDFSSFVKRGKKASETFNEKLNKLKLDKQKYEVYQSIVNKKIFLDKKIFEKEYAKQIDSTRNISGYVINKICETNPLLSLISPDISSSTKISLLNSNPYSFENRLGINLNIGVREFAMSAIINGIALVGLKAIGSTFLPFSDYCKPAIRLSSISKSPAIFVFSHDSIGVGEDGPTHQAIEQLWGLRLIPNHIVIRPCNYDETIKAFDFALSSDETAVSIITSRQEFELLKSNNCKLNRGAYSIKSEKGYDFSLIATGSEISLAYKVSEILLEKHNLKTNIVSMPSVELYQKQIDSYKETVINPQKPVVSLELGSSTPWAKFANLNIGINRFGLTGSFDEILKKLKLTPSDIANRILEFLTKK